jgi:hypothetical protein
MATVKILGDGAVSILLFRAMVKHTPKNDILDVFYGGNRELMRGRDTEVDVKVLINGVEVDFYTHLHNHVLDTCNNLDAYVETKARELLNESCGDIMNTLSNIQTMSEYVSLKVEQKT